ncbi:unnamed protein product [Zymoseptoria tritici ST99CH_3D7]|uniref:non-specific serine/threonine protein kinase n=1 Tax=Zymoseptoria tritici (strain ST99CH_3D7) TaxID=1276538 RepID=A0A1X7RCP8_ZYMT9|nr:unnamed protein product [Zymoseptoria tritici ST99CH_3D7]
MAANLFADLEVAANLETPGRQTTDSRSAVRRDAINQWNSFARQDQIALEAELNDFYSLHGQMEATTTAVLGNEPRSNVKDITNYRENLQGRVNSRNEYIATIDRLMTLRNAHATNRIETTGYLQRLRVKHVERRDNDTATISNLAPLLASEEQRNLEGRLNDRWIGLGEMEGGGYALPQVWVKRSTTNVITDRLVLKHINPAPPDATPSIWTADKKPIEAIAMLLLKTKTGSERIVKLRNWRLGPTAPFGETIVSHAWLYLEYCGHGDLFNYVVEQRKKYHPEAFLWSIFEDLVVAGLLFERGGLDSGAVAPGWALIVHRDIKMGNIFLGTSDRTTFQGYPTAKIGDFGAACFIADDDARQFEEFDNDNFGTETAKAPEQFGEELFGRPNKKYKMSSETNIWAIGNAMWSLVNKTEGDDQLAGGFREDYQTPAAFTEDVRTRYSSTLLDLIRSCIRYLPENRATLDDLRSAIQSATTPGSNDLADGLRNAPKTDPGFKTTARGPYMKAEGYKLGTLLSEWTEEIPPLPALRKRKYEDAPADTNNDDAASVASDDDLGGEEGSKMVPREQDLTAGLVFGSDDGDGDGSGGSW